MTKPRMTAAMILLLVVTAPSATLAHVLHVAPGGASNAPGTVERPLTLQAALDRVAREPAITGITLAGGEYIGSFSLPNPKDVEGSALPTLTIAAASGQVAMLRYSQRIHQAEQVPGLAGVYRTRTLSPSDPQMWERDTRIRYRTLATAGSVAVYRGSCHVDHVEGWLYFHTSDGEHPSRHEVWLSLSPDHFRGLAIYRPNVIIDGLHFADFTSNDNTAIQSYGNRLVIRRCHFDNCNRAWTPWTDSADIVMEDCTGVDVAQPVISYGRGVIVRRSTFSKSRDGFLFELYPQNDCGLQVYSPGSGGTFENNTISRYFNGILIKAGPGPYVIRHNTILDAHSGILFAATRDGCDVSHNIVVGARAFVHARDFPADFKLDRNLFWEPRELGEFDVGTQAFRGANLGKFNLLGDPRFVNPAGGDFRVQPDSPAVWLASEPNRPAGANPVATADDARDVPPTLKLAFAADSMEFGPYGDATFDRDPWIGGGTTHIRSLKESGIPRRVTGSRSIVVEPQAFDVIGTITHMSYAINDAAAIEIPYKNVHKLELPAEDGEYHLTVRVRNDRGVWSEPAQAMVRVDRAAPRLKHRPRVLASDHGVIITFESDEPCFARVQYGHTGQNLDAKLDAALRVERFWDSNDGGEWVNTWHIPRTEHAMPLLSPAIESGQTLHYRITLTDQAGLSSTSEVFTATASGAARVISVGPDGIDRFDSPRYRTLQYAVDRALPADRIVMEPGVYTDYTCMTHGGIDEARPITIEAATPGSVTLDGAKRHTAMVHLERAPWVTVRGLRIMYYRKAGIYAYRSPHTTIDQCVFFNGLGWVTGYHTFMFNSPHGSVSRCLAVGAEVGFYFLVSPHASVMHNTACRAMYAAACYVYSARETRQIGNSFAFAGNDMFAVQTSHPDEMQTFQSDHNNLGTIVSAYGDNAGIEQNNPVLWQQIKAQEFATNYPQSFQTTSKAVIALDGRRFLTLKEWVDHTGLDTRSIMADPQYIRPVAPPDHWNWRVSADSANTRHAPDGAVIGAFNDSP